MFRIGSRVYKEKGVTSVEVDSVVVKRGPDNTIEVLTRWTRRVLTEGSRGT